MGLQAKVILSFLGLLTFTLSAGCWMFYSHNRELIAEITSEQARQLASTLALGAQNELREGQTGALDEVAQALVQGRNILYVAFLDIEGRPVAHASRDPDFYLVQVPVLETDARGLMKVRPKRSRAFGEYVEIVAPVLGIGHTPEDRQLEGYVAVAMSQAWEEAQLLRATYLVVAIGCVMMLSAVPLCYLMTRRILAPIHELVRVTQKITRGDLDARVAVNRRDVIGSLARSFNEMVIWVKSQQQDVATANQKLAEANRDLEAKVAARTAQLETAMSRLSSEIAEKEDFLRAVSHDLNAPLRNISGMATMLLMKYREKLDEDVIHRLDRIKKNVDVEMDLIAELLELSRIKTRRQKLEPVDVERMIWELRGVFENDLKSNRIDLILDTALPILEAERARVRQVFQNLIDNAIKYMGDNGTRQIHVGCALRLTEAEFYVRDTGMGIEPEDIDKVFFVFRRGKNSAAQNIAGKGVGLASVKSIIETYNGKIWVESQPGRGTTFRFTINGKHVPATAQHASHAAAAPVKSQDKTGAESATAPNDRSSSESQAEPVLS